MNSIPTEIRQAMAYRAISNVKTKSAIIIQKYWRRYWITEYKCEDILNENVRYMLANNEDIEHVNISCCDTFNYIYDKDGNCKGVFINNLNHNIYIYKDMIDDEWFVNFDGDTFVCDDIYLVKNGMFENRETLLWEEDGEEVEKLYNRTKLEYWSPTCYVREPSELISYTDFLNQKKL